MRLQDKGKRFVVVDKETDRNKAQEQTDKTFVEDVRSRANQQSYKNCVRMGKQMVQKR